LNPFNEFYSLKVKFKLLKQNHYEKGSFNLNDFMHYYHL